MSVVVRMEMPKGCGDCRIAQFGYCGITHEPVADAYMGYPENRPKTCPILAVLPENHGRLVDAEALLRDIEQYHVSDGRFQHWLELQPTIVPADTKERMKTV